MVVDEGMDNGMAELEISYDSYLAKITVMDVKKAHFLPRAA